MTFQSRQVQAAIAEREAVEQEIARRLEMARGLDGSAWGRMAGEDRSLRPAPGEDASVGQFLLQFTAGVARLNEAIGHAMMSMEELADAMRTMAATGPVQRS